MNPSASQDGTSRGPESRGRTQPTTLPNSAFNIQAKATSHKTRQCDKNMRFCSTGQADRLPQPVAEAVLRGSRFAVPDGNRFRWRRETRVWRPSEAKGRRPHTGHWRPPHGRPSHRRQWPAENQPSIKKPGPLLYSAAKAR
jgi:hypothetical protein